MLARPAVGRRKPSSVRISVDFPAPLGPSRPTALPFPDAPRRQEIPYRISRRPNLTVRFSNSTTGVLVILYLRMLSERPPSSIASITTLDRRVRLARWICSGFPSKTMSIESRPASRFVAAEFPVNVAKMSSAPFVFTQANADGWRPADAGNWAWNADDQINAEP